MNYYLLKMLYHVIYVKTAAINIIVFLFHDDFTEAQVAPGIQTYLTEDLNQIKFQLEIWVSSFHDEFLIEIPSLCSSHRILLSFPLVSNTTTTTGRRRRSRLWSCVIAFDCFSSGLVFTASTCCLYCCVRNTIVFYTVFRLCLRQKV